MALQTNAAYTLARDVDAAPTAAAADDEGDEETNARHAFLAYRHQLNGVQCAEIAMMEGDTLDDEFDAPADEKEEADE